MPKSVLKGKEAANIDDCKKKCNEDDKCKSIEHTADGDNSDCKVLTYETTKGIAKDKTKCYIVKPDAVEYEDSVPGKCKKKDGATGESKE